MEGYCGKMDSYSNICCFIVTAVGLHPYAVQIMLLTFLEYLLYSEFRVVNYPLLSRYAIRDS